MVMTDNKIMTKNDALVNAIMALSKFDLELKDRHEVIEYCRRALVIPIYTWTKPIPSQIDMAAISKELSSITTYHELFEYAHTISSYLDPLGNIEFLVIYEKAHTELIRSGCND